MKQDRFIDRHQAEWIAFEQWLDARGDVRRRVREAQHWDGLGDADMPARYRRLCQHLALARRRGYSAVLTDRLQGLMQRGHGLLYRTPPTRPQRAMRFLLAGFPQLVRAERGAMLASLALFVVPLVAIFIAIQLRPELAASLFSPMELSQFEQMYDPADTDRLGRDGQTDVMMFGHYVWNNVSIGFRTFASGLLACVGAVIVLLTNGVMIGGVAGHLQAVGHGAPFWRFVAGHSAPELIAIVIAGGAGLRLGFSLIAPGRRTRRDALVQAGRRGALICVGVLAMLVFAAFVEAFWSSLAWMPAWIKYTVGAGLWTLIVGWLLLGGRDAADDASLRDGASA